MSSSSSSEWSDTRDHHCRTALPSLPLTALCSRGASLTSTRDGFLLWVSLQVVQLNSVSSQARARAGVAARQGCTCDILIVAVSNTRCQQWDINNIDRSLKALFCLDCYCFLESQKPRGLSSIPEQLVRLPHTFNYKSLAARQRPR